MCWPIATTICKALHGKIIYFPFLWSEWRNAHRRIFYHTADQWLSAAAGTQFATHTAVGAFGMKSRRVKLLQISCFSVCLNKTPKSLCAVSWLLKFEAGRGRGRWWAKFNEPSISLKIGRQKCTCYRNNKCTSKVSREWTMLEKKLKRKLKQSFKFQLQFSQKPYNFQDNSMKGKEGARICMQSVNFLTCLE